MRKIELAFALIGLLMCASLCVPIGHVAAQEAAQGAAQPTTLASIFSGGNDALFRGDYRAAEAAYQQLLDGHVDDPDVHFNLGIAHARQGQLGRAALDFERVLRLRPSDQQARETLAQLRDRVGRDHAQTEGEVQVGGGAPIGEVLFGNLTMDTHAWLFAVVEVLLFAVLAGLILAKPASRARLTFGVLSSVFAIFGVSLGIGLLSRAGTFSHGPTAVIVEDRVALHEGPSDEAVIRGRAMAAERATILREVDEYALVRVASGGEGWVGREAVEAIDLGLRAER